MAGEYRRLTLSMDVGRGPAAFDAAGRAIMSLQMQRGAGLRVSSTHEPVQLGDVVKIWIGIGPVGVSGSCDVIEVFDEPRRRGYTYRTRPDHVEDGEETFEASLYDDERVVVTIDAWSRPNSWLTRTAGPAGRLVQRLINRRYLTSVRRIVVASAL
ncbi:hypothetical protein BH10ACT8_BH10ACT8_31070 [soil metagenome]